MPAQALYPNSDVSRPAEAAKTGGDGSTYYSCINDTDTADYFRINGGAGDYTFEFGVASPTPVTGTVPVRFNVDYRQRRYTTASQVNEDSFIYVDISLDGGTTWIGEQLLYYATGNRTYNADTDYNVSTFAYELPVETVWASVTDIHVRLRLTNTSNLWYILYVYSLTLTLYDGILVSIVEPSQTLGISMESEYSASDVSINPAGAGYISVTAKILAVVAGNPAITKYRVQICSEPSFATPEIDSGDITASGEDSGHTISTIVAGSVSAAGTYYVRVGTATTTFPTLRYSDAISFSVKFCSITNVSVQMVGEKAIITVSVADDYPDAPAVTVTVDGESRIAEVDE
jgi:hypothetical protein